MILVSGLASATPSASANTGPLQTASMSWSGLSDNAVLSGGITKNFFTGEEGWSRPAFEQAGVIGVEWWTVQNPVRRQTYTSIEKTASLSPGEESSLSTTGYLIPTPNQYLQVDTLTQLSGHQARWSIRVEELSPDAFLGNTIFIQQHLPDGYQPVFTAQGSKVLLISDASGRFPTLVLHATTTSGYVAWGGGASKSASLVNGDRSPTVYVHDVSSSLFTVTFTLGVVDADPCSGAMALDFASAQASVFAKVWPTITSCFPAPEWEGITAGSSDNPRTLTLDPRVPMLDAHQARELSISGLPQGVTWTRAADSGSGVEVLLSSSAETTPGSYPLEFLIRTTRDVGGVITYSQRLRAFGTLTISAPPPPPAPEPEPDPEPETFPEPDPGPDQTPDPLPDPAPDPAPEEETSEGSPQNSADTETPVDTSEAAPPAEEEAREPDDQLELHEDPEPAPEDAEDPSSPENTAPAVEPVLMMDTAPSHTSTPLVEVVTAPAMNVPESLDPSVEFESATPPLPREEPFVQPLTEEQAPRKSEVNTQDIPEPSLASVWAGAGLLGLVGLGALWAVARRYREEEE